MDIDIGAMTELDCEADLLELRDDIGDFGVSLTVSASTVSERPAMDKDEFMSHFEDVNERMDEWEQNAVFSVFVAEIVASEQPIESQEEVAAHMLLAEAAVRRILDEKEGDLFPSTEYSLKDITYGVDASASEIASSGIEGKLVPGGKLTFAQVKQLQALFQLKAAAFSKSKIPTPNAAPPVKVKLKPDADGGGSGGGGSKFRFGKSSAPSHVPKPVTGEASYQALWKLRLFWEANDMLEPNQHGEWASRLNLVWKGPKDREGLYHDIRSTEDDRPLNSKAEKMK